LLKVRGKEGGEGKNRSQPNPGNRAFLSYLLHMELLDYYAK